MKSESDQRDPLEEAAESFLARLRAGEQPSLSEYEARHPELAGDIRDLFPALVMMEQGRRYVEDPPAPDPARLTVEQVPQQLGEYRLLREIGRGGMGVVYEARQESLGRHVALKVLPFNSLARPEHLERFRREARAAARLHHTNIVPVHGVGEHHGLHYYAMQFIHGQGLDSVLEEVRRLRGLGRDGPKDPVLATTVARRMVSGHYSGTGSPAGTGSSAVDFLPPNPGSVKILPASRADATSCGDVKGSSLHLHPDCQYFASVARIGAQAAEALAYAHSQGVVHRDIKPSNLLLDTSGRVWITDFGLAKADDSDELTQPGDILGTVRYMSPERFEGQADERSDVYGLGITLYEMLTLRPAFDQGPRGTLLEQIAHMDPPRPRQLDPRIPRDLETIVLKAMAKEPGRRYASAGELAEDLQRFRADRPIRARRVRTPERVWRWSRRNPALAGLIGSVVAGLLTVAILSSLSSVWLKGERDRAQMAEHNLGLQFEQTDKQRQRAEQEALRNQRLAYAADMQLAAQLWENEPAPARQVAELLQRYLPAPGEEDLREFTWHYQQRLLHDARELSVEQPVVAVRLTPDRHVLTTDGLSIRSSDKTSGKLAWQRPHPSCSRLWTDFTCDGKLIARATNDGRVLLCDTFTGKEHVFLRLGEIKDISLSPRGEALAVIQADGRTRAWEVPSGKQLGTFALSQASRWCVLSPDAKTLVIAPYPHHNELSIYRSGQKEPQIVSAPGRSVTLGAIAYSPDGRTIVAGDHYGWIDLYDASTGRHSHGFPPIAGRIDALAFSPDGRRLCAGTAVGLVTVWDLATRRPICQLKGHTAKVRSVAFAADGRTLVSASEDGTVRLWQLPPRSEHRILMPKTDRQDRVAYSPDGRWLAFGGPGTSLWDARTYRWVRRLDESCAVAFSPDSKLLAAGGADSLVRLWDPFTGRLVRTLSGRPKESNLGHRAITALSFSPDGKLLAAGFGYINWFEGNYGQIARVWEVASGTEVAELPHDNTVPSLQFSPDGQTLATACHDHRIRLWQVGSWQQRRSWDGPSDFAALAFVPDRNQLVTGNGDGVLQLWDADTGGLLRVFGQHAQRVYSLAFSPDGKTLASGSGADFTVKLWSLACGRELRTLRGHTSLVSGVAFAADGKALVSICESDGVWLWDTLTPWQRLQEARTALQADIASSPDSTLLHYRLGLIYNQLGQQNEARAEFSRAIDLDSHFQAALRARLFGYVRQGQWDKAALDLARLAQVKPDQHLHWYQAAPVCLLLGDKEEYRRICRTMLARFGNTNNPAIAERTAKTCLLAPDAVGDLSPVLKLADRAVTGTKHLRQFQYRHLVLAKALAEYRAGRHASAVSWLERFSPRQDGTHFDATAFAVLAMAQHRLDRAKEARAALASARAILATKMPDPREGRPFGGDWHDWLHAQILVHEADALLGVKDEKPGQEDSRDARGRP
jgi:WD40 repeat protein/serine/threonine protein kinase